MISFITPTHNGKFLGEVYESLKKQTDPNWEWIVIQNGEAKDFQLFLQSDPRCKRYNLPDELEGKGIGAIKQWAFMQGTGDYLAELDHDDLVTPDCVSELHKAFEESGADFVYSNTCDFFSNGNGHWFPDWEKNGWRYRDASIDGTWYNECISFQPSAASLGLIYYAPNHIRVWRSDFYKKMGGHNPQYRLCDDHELLIRTYLRGKMHHINKPLYLYRMGENNTFSKHLDEIRETSWRLYIANIEKLILREAELKGLPCYDLGGAFDCPDGWRSVDLRNADICCDLNKSWPFKDNSVLAFRAYDIFEHLKDKKHVMREASRCLVNGGYLHVQVPAYPGAAAVMDPDHKSLWVEQSFWYHTRAHKIKYNEDKKSLFMEQRLFTYETPDGPYVKAELINIKNGRKGIPGFCQI